MVAVAGDASASGRLCAFHRAGPLSSRDRDPDTGQRAGAGGASAAGAGGGESRPAGDELPELRRSGAARLQPATHGGRADIAVWSAGADSGGDWAIRGD